MASTTISRGNILEQFILQPTLTPTTVAATAAAEQTFTVIGLMLGDLVNVTSNVAPTASSGIVNSRVSAANTLAIQFGVTGTVEVLPAPGVYNVQVTRVEGTAPTADA